MLSSPLLSLLLLGFLSLAPVVQAARNITVSSLSSGVSFELPQGEGGRSVGREQEQGWDSVKTRVLFGFQGRALYLHTPPWPCSTRLSVKITTKVNDNNIIEYERTSLEFPLVIPCESYQLIIPTSASSSSSPVLWSGDDFPQGFHSVSVETAHKIEEPTAFDLFTYTTSNPPSLLIPSSPILISKRATTDPAAPASTTTIATFKKHIPLDLKLKLAIIACGILVLLFILSIYCICRGDRQFRKTPGGRRISQGGFTGSRPNSLVSASAAAGSQSARMSAAAGTGGFPEGYEPVITTTSLPDSPPGVGPGARHSGAYADLPYHPPPPLHYPPSQPVVQTQGVNRVPVPAFRAGTDVKSHGFQEYRMSYQGTTVVNGDGGDEKYADGHGMWGGGEK